MREVNSLEVKCPNDEAGCQWKGVLGSVDVHINGGPRAKGVACGFVMVECVYQCGLHFYRHSIQKHEEEECLKRPVDIQLKSGLRKIEGVIEENECLKQKVSVLKDKLNVVMEENKNLTGRVAKLEVNQLQKSLNPEIQSNPDLKNEMKELRTTYSRHINSSNRELQLIKQELEKIKRQQKAVFLGRQIPPKPIDPQNVVMVADLKEKGILKTERVEQTMKAIDRKHYAPANHYVDSPQSIGYNTSISAPHMHAHTLELLKDVLCDGATILDVGSGSGYLTACMAYMSAPSGYAVGIDRVNELTVQATENIKCDNPELLRYNMFMVTGDGHDGYPAKAPYDVIHVGGATPTVPQALYDQLKCGGRMIIPVGPHGGSQYLEQHDKKMDGTIMKKKLMGVRYGPLLKY